MKTVRFFAALAAAMTLFSCAPKANVEDPEAAAEAQLSEEQKEVKLSDFVPSKSLVDSVSYLVGFNFGYFIKANGFGEKLNYAQIKRGMMDVINFKGEMNDPSFEDSFKINPNMMNELFGKYIQMQNDYKAQKNLENGQKFLEKNAKKAGVVTTESGLQYQIVAEGEGEAICEKDTVQVYYVGTFVDGKEFDSCKEEDEKDPFQFTVTNGSVIAGWVEGVQLAKKGGEINLYIPSELAYGRGSYQMEPNQTLVFNVKVVDVKKYVEPVAEEVAE